MKETVDLVKSFFDILKQGAIVTVIVCLFASPATIGLALDKMGLHEADLWGFKWKRRLVETDAELVAVRASLAELERQLKLADETIGHQSHLLVSEGAQLSNRTSIENFNSVVAAAQTIRSQNAAAITLADKVSSAVQDTISANAPLVARAEEQAGAAPQWAVVAGGDPTEAGARDELARARTAGYSDTKLFRRIGSFRTVIAFPIAQQQTAHLPMSSRRCGDAMPTSSTWIVGARAVAK